MPEWRAARLEAGELSFARLIGFLFRDPRQRPMHRAPCATRSRDAEPGRRYLLVRGALNPEGQCLLLVLSGFELSRPRRSVAPALFVFTYRVDRSGHPPPLQPRFSSFTTGLNIALQPPLNG